MALTLAYHVYLVDGAGTRTELPGSPYPTANTADAACSAYEAAHPGSGGYYDEVRRFDQPKAAPPAVGIFRVSQFTCLAEVGSPASWQATLLNASKNPVSAPGVGLYGVADGKQLGWASSASQIIAPGQSLVIDPATAENQAAWTPTTAGDVAVVAKPGSNGVDANDGAFAVHVNVTKATTPTPPPIPAGKRDCALWPFKSDDPFNLPLGVGAQWANIRDRGTPWINRDAFSIPVYFAKSSDGPRTFNASGGSHPGPNTIPNFPANAQSAAGSDRHLAIISPDRRYSYEMWNCDVGAGTSGTFMRVDLQGPGVGLGWCRATGVSVIAGLIRRDELKAGVIPHTLAMAGGQGWCGVSGQPWPAISNDDGGQGEGTWLGIPQGVKAPSGMSKGTAAIFTALQTYGGMNVDIAGANVPVLYVEVGTPDADMPGDLGPLAGLIQRVTNYSQANVGGPGARVGAMAPGF